MVIRVILEYVLDFARRLVYACKRRIDRACRAAGLADHCVALYVFHVAVPPLPGARQSGPGCVQFIGYQNSTA